MHYIEIPLEWGAEVVTTCGHTGIAGRMEVRHHNALLGVFVVSGAENYPSLSARLWSQALEVIQRRGLCGQR